MVRDYLYMVWVTGHLSKYVNTSMIDLGAFRAADGP